VRIILHEDILITSDEQGVQVYALGAGAPVLSATFAQPTLQNPFALHRDGEALTAVRAGGFVRAFVSPEAPQKTQLARFDLSLRLLSVAPAAVRLNRERLDLSHDGARVAATAFGEGVVVLDAVTGAKISQSAGHMGSGAAWSPDDRLIAAGDSGQAGGALYLLALGAEDQVTRHPLPKPTSKMPLYDSPFDVAFAPDGGRVAFSSAAWGRRGVVVYEVATRAERWSVSFPMGGGGEDEDEEQETWEALDVAFAVGGEVVLCGVEGRLQAWRAADGVALTPLPCDGATSTRFAADDRRQRVWFARDGALAWEPYPTDWR
jgi:hypothetical protein